MGSYLMGGNEARGRSKQIRWEAM